MNPLCSRPECNHEGSDCNAYFAGISDIFYYAGDLYVLKTEKRERTGQEKNYPVDLNLYRLSLDGSERTYVHTLYTAVYGDGMKASIMEFHAKCIQHRGYLYYAYNVENYDEAQYYNYGSNCIHRLNLETFKEDEKVIAYFPVGMNYQFSALQGMGSYVYYMLTDETGMGEAYRFNTENLTNEKLDLGIIAQEDLKATEGGILYKKDWDGYEFYEYDPYTGMSTLFANLEDCGFQGCYTLSADRENIYVTCRENINADINYVILDTEGEIADTVETSVSVGRYINAGRDVMLYVGLVEEEYYYLDKSKLGTGNAAFEKIQ